MSKQSAKSPKSKYIIEIDKDACIGAASCIAIAGKTFKLDENNKVLILEGEWDDDDMIMAAAQSCPVFAISIKNAETGAVIFPQT